MPAVGDRSRSRPRGRCPGRGSRRRRVLAGCAKTSPAGPVCTTAPALDEAHAVAHGERLVAVVRHPDHGHRAALRRCSADRSTSDAARRRVERRPAARRGRGRRGSTASARAMLTRCASPPESLSGGARRDGRCRAGRAPRRRAARASAPRDAAQPQPALDVAAHGRGEQIRLLEDGRRAAPQRAGGPRAVLHRRGPRRPARRRPRSSPLSARSSVLLPAPLGPSSTCTSPARTAKRSTDRSTQRSTRVAAASARASATPGQCPSGRVDAAAGVDSIALTPAASPAAG